jgi:hypothetical protein
VVAVKGGAVPDLRVFRGPDLAAIDAPFSLGLDLVGGIEVG